MVRNNKKARTGDLAGQLRLPFVDEGVQAFANHVLLLLRGRSSQSRRREGLVRRRGSLKTEKNINRQKTFRNSTRDTGATTQQYAKRSA